MALLIDVNLLDWVDDEELLGEIAPHAPGADLRTYATMGAPDDIAMVATSRLRNDLPARLPNLRLIQKLGAGVDTMVGNPNLPDHVRITRLRPAAPAQEIAEFCLAYVLREQRHMSRYESRQKQAKWDPLPPRQAHETTVGILGLGHIGGRTARLFRDLGFRTKGWSSSPKSLDGIDCRHGDAALYPLLGECDYIVSILPSTPATRGLVDSAFLGAAKPNAILINAGRGDLVSVPDLLTALDDGKLGGAVLDVVPVEPLPADDPLWFHPKVTITPHVSGWHQGDAMKDVAENYRRLMAGEPLLNEVDRAKGY